ncbi:MAG: DUF4215 domain-containing protein [Polyangiaceae bacterium]
MKTSRLIAVLCLTAGCQFGGTLPSNGNGECTLVNGELNCVFDDGSAFGGSNAGAASQGGGTSQGGASQGGAAVVGGASSQGGSGGAPLPAPDNDSCATAAIVDVGSGQQAFEHGTFAGANDDESSFCAEAGGPGLPDVVYQLSLAAECTTTLTVDGPVGIDGVISLRSQDCSIDEYCVDHPGNHELFRASLDAGTYWVVVSNVGTEQGPFTLSIDCAIPTCGDGVLNATGQEQCDDGNSLDGDGCSSTCRFEAADSTFDTCEGAAAAAPIIIGPAETVHVPSAEPLRSTIGATDSGTGSCSLQPDGVDIIGAPDHVYRVRPSANGTLRVTLGLGLDDQPYCGTDPNGPTSPYPTGCYDRAVHVREGVCDSVANEVACSDNPYDWWAPEEVLVTVAANVDYYVFVDGWNDDAFGSGVYDLRLELQ